MGIDRSVILRLFISNVFAMRAVFDSVATRVMAYGLGQLSELGLPIAECSELVLSSDCFIHCTKMFGYNGLTVGLFNQRS